MMFNNLKQYGTFSGQLQLGSVCHYRYDAKTKDKLPIWDMFPLAIPFEIAEGGWFSMNLHYVSKAVRKAILSEFIVNSAKEEHARLNANYRLMKQMALYDELKPTIKRYLTDHLRSRFLIIDTMYWDKIIQLPTAQWVKKK
ncbi:MAG: hypothetical protein ACREQ5_08350 [Candidatus Dormibacteria bacterium]